MIVLGLLILFLIWSILVVKSYINNTDNKFYNRIKIKEPFISFFKTFTNLADAKFFVMACLIFLLFLDSKVIACLFTCLMLGEACMVSLLKHLFKRMRPNINQLVYEKGFSYPSGHTFGAVSFYGFLLFLIIMSGIILPIKLILGIFIILIILLIGYSRIFLGVHYFSDIVGALLVGNAYLLSYIYLVHNILNLL